MTVDIICADVRDGLARFPDGHFHCCVTSPPYWSLRDYQLEPTVWGNGVCEHEWGSWQENHDEREQSQHGKTRTTDRFYGDESRRFDGNHQKHSAGAFCRRCNAWRGTLGLEPTPELFCEHLVAVMREVRRVLRDDGTLWLNLGDSYTSGGRDYRDPGKRLNSDGRLDGLEQKGARPDTPLGLKPKDLVGVPWMVAFALRADGWWLRSDIIWSKRNCMPESVRDRPTRSHEYLFLLTKRERYYYDADAIREACESGPSDVKKMIESRERIGGIHKIATDPLLKASSLTNIGRKRAVGSPAGRNRRSVWEIATQPFGMEMCSACMAVYDAARYRRLRSGGAPRCQFEVAEDEKCGGSKFEPLDGRWQCIACDTMYTVKGLQRLPRAARCACGRDDAWIGHFAVFPEKLVEPCILAGCPEGGTVLDPFSGSGTVGLVAERLGRHSVLIDAKEEYYEMARARTAQRGLMAEVK